MPRELFSQTIPTVPGRSRSRWTILGSFVVHSIAVVFILVLPIVSGALVPDISRQIEKFVIARQLPAPPAEPPAPPPAARTLPPDLKVDAAPVVSAETIGTEPEILPAGTGTYTPGALPAAGTHMPGELLTSGRPTQLSAPPPVRTDPIRVGGAIKPPQRVSYLPPVYPPIAIQARVDGTVELEATIDATGAVQDVKVIKSIPLLDRAAIDAVSRWRYTPTRLNGVAVPVLMTITVTFTLR